VHGLLHLLGYDHERSPAEARRMFARERELAAALRRAGRSRNSLPHVSLRRTKPAAPARLARGDMEPREHLE
jgi:pyridoxine 5-phosphate synthase